MKNELLKLLPASGPLQGRIVIPGDKSISHRAVMLGALAEGETRISGFLMGEDCLSTIRAFRDMGVRIEVGDGEVSEYGAELTAPGNPKDRESEVLVHGVGLNGLKAPSGPIDCGNSGTTMRLIMGILAAQPFPVQLTGDESLCRRPMGRVAGPLAKMGAEISPQTGPAAEAFSGATPESASAGKDEHAEAVTGNAPGAAGESKKSASGGKLTAPLMLAGHPGALKGISYASPVASAQVKSAVLLAGLYADSPTTVSEPALSRDHTERMLKAFGARVETGVEEASGRPFARVFPLARRDVQAAGAAESSDALPGVADPMALNTMQAASAAERSDALPSVADPMAINSMQAAFAAERPDALTGNADPMALHLLQAADAAERSDALQDNAENQDALRHGPQPGDAPGASGLHGMRIRVPGDISSAVCFLAAASLVPGSELLLENVGINPTRDGFLRVLEAMGGDLSLENEREEGGEPCADIRVRYAPLHGIRIEGAIIPTLIDELPMAAVLGAFAEGETVIGDAAELRVKESDRIAAMTESLGAMGADIEAKDDGWVIRGNSGKLLKGAVIDPKKDHRIAMSMAVAALRAEGETLIKDADCVNISFPGFYTILDAIKHGKSN